MTILGKEQTRYVKVKAESRGHVQVFEARRPSGWKERAKERLIGGEV